jgi:hypothetical protein
LTSIQTGKKYAGKVVDKAGLVKPKVIDKVGLCAYWVIDSSIVRFGYTNPLITLIYVKCINTLKIIGITT